MTLTASPQLPQHASRAQLAPHPRRARRTRRTGSRGLAAAIAAATAAFVALTAAPAAHALNINEYMGELPDVVYYVGTRAPQNVDGNGFAPLLPPGTDLDLLRLALGTDENGQPGPSGDPGGSGFIRTTDSAESAAWLAEHLRAAGRDAWIYRIHPGGDFHHLGQSLDALADQAEARAQADPANGPLWRAWAEHARWEATASSWTNEWVAVGAIPSPRILGATRFRPADPAHPDPADWGRRAGPGDRVYNVAHNPELAADQASRELIGQLPDVASLRRMLPALPAVPHPGNGTRPGTPGNGTGPGPSGTGGGTGIGGSVVLPNISPDSRQPR